MKSNLLLVVCLLVVAVIQIGFSLSPIVTTAAKTTTRTTVKKTIKPKTTAPTKKATITTFRTATTTLPKKTSQQQTTLKPTSLAAATTSTSCTMCSPKYNFCVLLLPPYSDPRYMTGLTACSNVYGICTKTCTNIAYSISCSTCSPNYNSCLLVYNNTIACLYMRNICLGFCTNDVVQTTAALPSRCRSCSTSYETCISDLHTERYFDEYYPCVKELNECWFCYGSDSGCSNCYGDATTASCVSTCLNDLHNCGNSLPDISTNLMGYLGQFRSCSSTYTECTSTCYSILS
jgi:hypothetical protein